jgi:hypothetical protein
LITVVSTSSNMPSNCVLEIVDKGKHYVMNIVSFTHHNRGTLSCSTARPLGRTVLCRPLCTKFRYSLRRCRECSSFHPNSFNNCLVTRHGSDRLSFSPRHEIDSGVIELLDFRITDKPRSRRIDEEIETIIVSLAPVQCQGNGECALKSKEDILEAAGANNKISWIVQRQEVL